MAELLSCSCGLLSLYEHYVMSLPVCLLDKLQRLKQAQAIQCLDGAQVAAAHLQICWKQLPAHMGCSIVC